MLLIIIKTYFGLAFLFILNFIPFCRWVKKQNPTSEFLLYQVRGRFRFFNVLVWLDEMEKVLPKKLSEERSRIAVWKKKSDQIKKPFYRYKTQVKRLLFMKSFGDSPRLTAFKRLALYPKIVYIWHWILTLSFANCMSIYFLTETRMEYIEVAFFSILAGAIPGLVIFNLVKIIMNSILVNSADDLILKKGNAGYYHELLHQLVGLYNGHFQNIDWDDTPKTKLSGLDGSDATVKFIKNNYFNGGSSAGTW